MISDNSSVALPVTPRGFVTGPFAYHDIVTVEIQSLNHMGVGVGKAVLSEAGSDADSDADVDCGHTVSVHVPMGLPGEVVRARIYRNMPAFSESDLGECITLLYRARDIVHLICAACVG